MEQVLLFATVLAPIIIAVVELIKRTVSLPKNYVALLSFVVGIGIGVIAYPFTDLELVLRLWSGALAGLSATGLFEIGNKREGMTKS